MLRGFAAGNDLTGRLRMPLLTLHSTGDGQVPINQALRLRALVRGAGSSNLLVQRVLADTSHCGFTTSEQEAGLAALVRWVEHGTRPAGTNLALPDLTNLPHTFELQPRDGTRAADAVPGAHERVVVSGRARLDGAAFNARWLGANVRRNGLITACGLTLVPVDDGRYEIPVVADPEQHGCGGPGAEILLWTFVGDKTLASTNALPWPRRGAVTFDANFSAAAPRGAEPRTTGFSGEVYRRDGRRLPPGTRIEAFVDHTRCGISSVKRTGNYSGFILAVVGPSSVAGCRTGARLTFRIDGHRAIETATHQLGSAETLDLTVQ